MDMQVDRATSTLYAKLEDRVLARDQIGASQVYYDLVRAGRPLDLREVDVSLDPVLHARYGERIPVVVVGGREAFEYHVDATELARLLDTVTP